jgi:hypothetical protein
MAGADAIEIGGFGDLGFFPRRSRSTGSRQTDPPRLQHATGEGPTRRGTGGEGVNGEGEEGGDGWVGLPSGTTAGVILQTREKLAPFGDTTRRGRTREELGDVAEIVPRPDEVWRRRPHRRCHGPLGLGFRAAGWGPSLHAYGSWLRLGWRRARRHRGNPPPRWSALGRSVGECGGRSFSLCVDGGSVRSCAEQRFGFSSHVYRGVEHEILNYLIHKRNTHSLLRHFRIFANGFCLHHIEQDTVPDVHMKSATLSFSLHFLFDIFPNILQDIFAVTDSDFLQ